MRALIFDLDGTLVDTVYAHVFAWQRALAEAAMPIDGWRIHRRMGMSGGLFTRAVARELGRPLAPEEAEGIQARHGELFAELLLERRPLPGAVELLATLREAGLKTDLGLKEGKLGQQLKHADRLGAPLVIIVGTDEMRTGTFSLRTMATGDELKGLKRESLVATVRGRGQPFTMS